MRAFLPVLKFSLVIISGYNRKSEGSFCALSYVMKFEKWGEKEPHMKLMCGCEDKVLT